MRKTLTKVIYIKSLVTFFVLTCAGIIALVTIGNKLFYSLASKEEIFIPGVVALILAVLLLLLFGVTRVIKYVKLLFRKSETDA